MIATKAALAFILVILAVGGQCEDQQAPIKVSPTDMRCKVSQDCAWFQPLCCGCDHTRTPVNAKSVASYNSLKNCPPRPCTIMCPRFPPRTLFCNASSWQCSFVQAQAQPASSIRVAPQDQKCKRDTDCTSVAPSCCSCPLQAIPVNRMRSQSYLNQLNCAANPCRAPPPCAMPLRRSLICNASKVCQWAAVRPMPPPANRCATCVSSDWCKLAQCNNNTGVCSFLPRSCDDNDMCASSRCDSARRTCLHTPISCDDGNPCTKKSCDGRLGCLITPIAGCTTPRAGLNVEEEDARENDDV